MFLRKLRKRSAEADLVKSRTTWFSDSSDDEGDEDDLGEPRSPRRISKFISYPSTQEITLNELECDILSVSPDHQPPKLWQSGAKIVKKKKFPLSSDIQSNITSSNFSAEDSTTAALTEPLL